MSAPVCQFVDRVGTGAVTRLNLNDGKYLRLLAGPDPRPGPDFSPPPLKRAVVNTLLAEGASIPASAYDNRIIRLPLLVKACDEEEMAEILETLHRELDRANNILKWHPTYNSRPVYFRTFRSPDYRLDQTMEGRGELRATLAILAEPFAYGDYVESTGTVYNDPAAVANGLYFTIVGDEGDVPTPLFLWLETAQVNQKSLLLATRRHGSPSLLWSQCEAMAQGANTVVVPDAAFSGGSKSRTTPGLAGWETRLTWDPCPSAGASVDWRGVYRVFLRAMTTGIATWGIRMLIGPAFPAGYWIYTDEVVLAEGAGPQESLLDLGLISIPMTNDPVYDGYSNVVLPVEPAIVRFQARRTAGAANLDWDYVVLVPADEELAIVQVFASSIVDGIFDGPNDLAYLGDGSQVLNRNPVAVAGSIPLVTPNQTNLYVVLRGLRPLPDTWLNIITESMTYTARYWPRYLYIR